MSLDAPLVAFAWVYMLKDHKHFSVVETGVVAVLVAVIWAIYVLDRIYDVHSGMRCEDGTQRHAFSWKWKKVLLPLSVVVLITALIYTYFALPAAYLTAGMVVGVLSILYFLLIPTQTEEVSYLKNTTAGLVFALGVAIPVNLFQAQLPGDLVSIIEGDTAISQNFLIAIISGVVGVLQLFFSYLYGLIGSGDVILFAVICTLNMTLIDFWEREAKGVRHDALLGEKSFINFGLLVVCILSLIQAMTEYYDVLLIGSRSYFYFVVLGAGLLLMVLNMARKHFNLEDKRILADIALILPVGIYFIINYLS